MRLYRWQGAAPNFGDELNTLLWPRLLPGFFDDNPAQLFLGIGSVLDARHPADAVKLVAGAGYGGYQPLPMLNARWVIHWVRGPRTARLLGLPPARGLGDPAMLLPLIGGHHAGGDRPAAARIARAVGFMPHFESAGRGDWAAVCAAAGIELIDPRGEPATIVGAIARCGMLIGEAMHGVIVADALRVPWIAVRPLAAAHRAKWHDWGDALGLRVAFRDLAASSMLERLHATPVAAFHRGRRFLDIAGPALRRLARRRFVERASHALALAATGPPQLSAASALDRCQAQMLETLKLLRRDPFRV